MSGQCSGWVWRNGPKPDDKDSNGERYGLERARAMRAVLGVIADASNRDGEHARPGLQAMVEGSLYTRSHVVKMVGFLIEDGWVEVEEVGHGRGHATVYRVLMLAEHERSSRRTDSQGEKVLQLSTKGPLVEEERSSGSDKRSSGTPSDQQVRAPNGKNNGKDSTEKNNVLVFAPTERDDFDAFWSVYPLKAAKETARRAFAKAAKKAPVEVLIDGARRYRDDPNRVAQFTKHPATWLNGGCWDDEPLKPRHSGGKRDPNAGVNQIVRRFESKYGGEER